MPEFELEDTSVATRNGRVPPSAAVGPSNAVPLTGDERMLLTAFTKELDTYYVGMNTFEGMEPDDVMGRIAAIVARLTEIRARLHRLGTTRATQLRTREVDPMLDSLKLLFSIHSRLLASRQFDWEMTRGGT